MEEKKLEEKISRCAKAEKPLNIKEIRRSINQIALVSKTRLGIFDPEISNQGLTVDKFELIENESDWSFCLLLFNGMSMMNDQQRINFRRKAKQVMNESLKEC